MPQNDRKASGLYRRAGDQDNGLALMLLAAMHHEGRVKDSGDAEALQLLKEAAELGHTHSEHLLSVFRRTSREHSGDSSAVNLARAFAVIESEPTAPQALIRGRSGGFR